MIARIGSSLYKARAHVVNLIPFLTHSLAALLPLAWAAALGRVDLRWELIVAAVVIGNLADVDTSYSHVGRVLYPLSRIVERRWGHRTVTHSLLALSVVTGTAYLVTDAWLWAAVFYGMHLVLDMIVGGGTGAPLLWPAPWRFYLFEVKPGNAGEKAIALLLAFAVTWPLTQGVPDPASWLHRTTGRLDYALQDYRAWEPYYHVWAEIEGTWQADHRPISGRFEILSVVEDTLILNIDGRQVTAGQRDEDIYIRRIVAVRGAPRSLPSTPQALATPAVVRIRVDHVLDPEHEVLVKPGDQVKRGQTIADLAGYRARLMKPPPTPSPTPTWTPTPTPDLWALEKARADLELARTEATAAARRAYPRPEDLQAAEAKLALAARELQQAQAAYDKEAWRPEIKMLPVALRLERATNEYQLAAAEATAVARIDTDALTVAAARLRLAELAYRRAVVSLTPVPVTPPAATPTPWPTLDLGEIREKTTVRSIVAGRVVDVRIVAVQENEATVEIAVQLEAGTAPPASVSAPTVGDVGRVVEVIDGDTVLVRLSGAVEPIKVRLIGVDTPETKHPDKPVQCFGPQASSFTRSMLLGREVRLEYDVERRDKYGRVLAYVWLGDDLFNARLVSEGYARTLTIPPNVRYSERFAALEREARARRRGLWGACE